jgi:hypothetical protein
MALRWKSPETAQQDGWGPKKNCSHDIHGWRKSIVDQQTSTLNTHPHIGWNVSDFDLIAFVHQQRPDVVKLAIYSHTFWRVPNAVLYKQRGNVVTNCISTIDQATNYFRSSLQSLQRIHKLISQRSQQLCPCGLPPRWNVRVQASSQDNQTDHFPTI